MPRLITEANLGAWLIKCDPEVSSDVPRLVRQPGLGRVTKWCVADNYRSRMMRPGDRAILWVSGNGRRLTRGIWGVGWVTGSVPDPAPEEPRPSSHDVALDIRLFGSGQEIAAADLVAAGITDL